MLLFFLSIVSSPKQNASYERLAKMHWYMVWITLWERGFKCIHM